MAALLLRPINLWNMKQANVLLLLLFWCSGPGFNPYPTIGAIPPPAGYHRTLEKDPFASWLRSISLKKDRTVYLYDGSPKRSQDAQFAVLDISVGHQDLQQCADAVMRLRAEYLYTRKDYANISFYTTPGVRLNYLEWAKHRHKPCEERACFDDYLLHVFQWCGTLSLEKQLTPIPHFGDLGPGDVLIKGGSPGHAMLVIDVAENAAGHKVYMLAQSYMPAQDIHIVKDPVDGTLSPWYRIADNPSPIFTPEWTFYSTQLRGWAKK